MRVLMSHRQYKWLELPGLKSEAMAETAFFLMTSGGRLHWLQQEVYLSVSIWKMTLIFTLFIISVNSFLIRLWSQSLVLSFEFSSIRSSGSRRGYHLNDKSLTQPLLGFSVRSSKALLLPPNMVTFGSKKLRCQKHGFSGSSETNSIHNSYCTVYGHVT